MGTDADASADLSRIIDAALRGGLDEEMAWEVAVLGDEAMIAVMLAASARIAGEGR